MVYTSLVGSTLLRTQRSLLPLPRTFYRYKSITAAIERGRQNWSDRPSRPRTRNESNNVGNEGVKTRRELRLERFGPPREEPNERAQSGSNELTAKPRSSRFGRVGSPTASSDAVGERRGTRGDPFGDVSGTRGQRRDGRGHERRDLRSGSERPNRSFGTPERRFERPGRADERSERPVRRRFDDERRPGRSERPERTERTERTFKSRDDAPSYTRERSGREQTERSGRPENAYRKTSESSSYPQERFRRDQAERKPDESSRKYPEQATKRSSVREPESLAYTTAASEFIYGYSSVLAALKANRRKLYQLYVHSRGASRDGFMARIRALKLFPITQEVGDEYLRAMDKASSGRPHNGVVLESSPLPVLPITELKSASFEDESFRVSVDGQSAEDALVNGKQDLYSYKASGWRQPLLLYVDGVLDEGNLGAIARSAYFLGVDAIITPTRQIAPWSHIAVKASAGAAEAIPLFKVAEPADFLGKSSRAGWKIYASDAVPGAPPSTTPDVQADSFDSIVYTFAKSTKRLPVDHCPVAEHPTILMMGAEGTGLRTSLLNMAHYKVGIQHGREVDEIGVDSLNVSVAASLLCHKMLQRPKPKPAPKSEDVLF